MNKSIIVSKTPGSHNVDLPKGYSEHLTSLFFRGELPSDEWNRSNDLWPNYISLFDITRDDIPELIKLMSDKDIENNETEKISWAPIYAWRLLGQLKATEAIPCLIDRLKSNFEECSDHEFDEFHSEDGWVSEEIPVILGMMGGCALESLSKELMDVNASYWFTIYLLDSFTLIGKNDFYNRESCIAAINNRLALFSENNYILNGFLIYRLLNLEAAESLDLIRNAYASENVDLTICGDVEDAEIYLGVRKERETPERNYFSEKYPVFEKLAEQIKSRGDELDELLERCNNKRKQILVPIRQDKKIGRNDSCICGSGKKYKKCCL